jgi:CheY-like chemotaxis protein
VNQMSRIVEDLIDVSRIVEKKVELRLRRIDLAGPVNAAIETCRSYMESCGHEVILSLPSEPVETEGDPERLTQVFINLLNNAAKFTERSGKIWVDVGREGPGWLVVRVRDSGIGISDLLLPHIFEMFTQGARAPEHGRGGLGIGLALAHSLVQMHRGTLVAHSAGQCEGAEFVVRLPSAKPRSKEVANWTSKPNAKAKAVPRRILVIDDSHDQAKSLGLLLELMGHEVRLEYDGQAGLAAAAEFLPDVALIDIGLPGLSGHEVARRIREDGRLNSIVLVAQTGWGQDEDRRRSQEAGFDHHLVKPIELAVLEGILANLPGRDDSA